MFVEVILVKDKAHTYFMSNYIDSISLRVLQGFLAEKLVRKKLFFIYLAFVIGVYSSLSKQDDN